MKFRAGFLLSTLILDKHEKVAGWMDGWMMILHSVTQSDVSRKMKNSY